MINESDKGSSLTYMYGLSDFWSDSFEDSEVVEAILAQETMQLSDSYSYFLQRSAGISLQDIQRTYKTDLKLVLISVADMISPREFRIDPSIESFKYVSNRPLLPTETLEEGRHFEVDPGVLRLGKPIGEYKFPVRYTLDGTPQYAIWLSDVEINAKWIDNSFGKLVGFTEEDALENYKSFLEGTYYLYANGPNVSHIERGVNLAMGMPYARETEPVLRVVRDQVTGNYVVFTATQAYEVPYQYTPSLKVGDVLQKGQVLDDWVLIKDYVKDGAWWYDIFLPKEVLTNGQDPLVIGRCTKDSMGDKIIKDFLKHHMFEVLMTQPAGDVKSFKIAKRVVEYSKPAYTFPVFVWKAPVSDEELHLEDDFTFTLKAGLEDTCINHPSISLFRRDTGLFNRGKHWYTRSSAPMDIINRLGYGDFDDRAGWVPELETITDIEKSWLAVGLGSRAGLVKPFGRGVNLRGYRTNDEVTEYTHSVVKGVDCIPAQADQVSYSSGNAVSLYLMLEEELLAKLAIINPQFQLEGREKLALRGLNLKALYDILMVREPAEPGFHTNKVGLEPGFSPYAYEAYVPDREGIPEAPGDLFLQKMTAYTWSVQWIVTEPYRAPRLRPTPDSSDLWATYSYDLDSLQGVRAVTHSYFETQTVVPKVGLTDITQTIVMVDGVVYDYADYNLEGSDLHIDDVPSVKGAVIWVEPTGLPEEYFPATGLSYTLATDATKASILVLVDGNPVFDYTITGKALVLANAPVSKLTVRRINGINLHKSLGKEIRISSPGVLVVGDGVLLDDSMYIHEGDKIVTSNTYAELWAMEVAMPIDTSRTHVTRGMAKVCAPKLLMSRHENTNIHINEDGSQALMSRDGILTTPIRVKRRL